MTDYQQPRCPHGWVDVTQCESCAQAAEIDRLHTLLQTALEALCLPCDRWNKQQTEIVNAAIAAIREAVK